MTVASSWRKIIHTGLALIIVALFCSVESLTTEHVCSGDLCYNNGSFEYSDGHCVCRCPTGYFGLLCEIELVPGAWPDGPYALLMPRSGCPEAVNRGWRRGFVHFSMATPITIRLSSISSNQSGSDIEGTIYQERGSNIEGPISSAYVRLNFCFKLETGDNLSEQIWPDGNYSIFGTEDGCPEDFIEETFTFNLPAFRSWMKDGYLPYNMINVTTSEIVVKLCRRTSNSSHYNTSLGSFVVLKNSDTSCDSGNNGYDVIEETIEFLDTNAHQIDISSNNSISFCHFWNLAQYKLQPCAYDKHHCGRGHCIPIPQLCDGTADCLDGNDENDDLCPKKCNRAEFHCGKGVCVSLDVVCDFKDDCPDGSDESDDEGFCKQIYGDYYYCFKFTDWFCDEGFCLRDDDVCDGWDDCLDGSDEEANLCTNDKGSTCSINELECDEGKCVLAYMCSDSVHCSLNDDSTTKTFCEVYGDNAIYCGDGLCLSSIYICDGVANCADGRDELPANCNKKCTDSWTGNYYCHEDGCLSHQTACSELSECDNKYISLECLHDLGLSDGTIRDFQISASSSKIYHEPPMVRPTLNSWCPTEDDIDPFLQIDFYAPNLVEGLIIYNKFRVRGTIDGNEYTETITPVGCRSFAVSYALFPDAFQTYMDQPFQIDFALNYSEPQSFRFLKPFITRFIRVHISSPIQGGNLCLQLEALGCRGNGYLTVDCDADSDPFWVEYPLLKPSSSPIDLPGNQSLDECQEVCKSQFDRCTAVDFIPNQRCRVFERAEKASYEDTSKGKLSTSMHLQICLTEEDTDFFSTIAGGHFKAIQTYDTPGEMSSLGYPFLYQSRMVYHWKIVSLYAQYPRITFVDISLYQPTTGERDDCDVIALSKDTDLYVNEYQTELIDYSYNGRTPTVPARTIEAAVTFTACQRYTDGSNYHRGFLFLYQFDYYPTIMWTLPAVLYSASLLGLDKKKEAWMRSSADGRTELAFDYFYVPCSDEFLFSLNGEEYCNKRRPRERSKEFHVRISFEYSGNLSKYSPEGFVIIISLATEEYEGPVILIHGGKRIPASDVFQCRTTRGAHRRANVDFRLVCDDLLHCDDRSDEEACGFINTVEQAESTCRRCTPCLNCNQSNCRSNYGYEPVNAEMDGESLEGIETCSEELQKCFVYLHLEITTTIGPNAIRKTWNEQSSICYKGGFSLPSIHSRGEVWFIRKWMQALHMYDKLNTSSILVNPEYNYKNLMFYTYIGLLRYKSAVGWDQIWQDGSKVSFTQWDRNEPADGSLNQCTEMVLGLYSDKMVWKSRPCDEVLPGSIPENSFYGTICERQFKKKVKGYESTIIDINNGSLFGIPMEDTKLHVCSSGEWIFRLALCDGVLDCTDGSDEESCETRTAEECLDVEFRCTSGECIHLDKVCDHNYDCSPTGDDEFCNFPPCEDAEFRCFNQRCIPLSSRCDSFVDCEDRSDELDCLTCNTNTSFLCADLTCIHKSKVCDGWVNCEDGRDERVCEQPFTSCHDLWLSGYRKNVTIEVDEEDTIECEFHLIHSEALRIVTTIEMDTTWQGDPVKPYVDFETANLREHGKICEQEIWQECSESEWNMAMFYDPYLDGSFSHCRGTMSWITITFSESCDDITYYDVYGEFIVVPFPCHGYRLYPDYYTKDGTMLITIGPVICEAEYQITGGQMGCEDGTVASLSQRCLFDKARGGHTDGCRNFKHLENCEHFKCPVDYVKCPGSFCLERSFLCDGDRQCPGGEDELGCWCKVRETSLAIIYYGTAREDVRPYIFRLARQFYWPNKMLQMISYTVQEYGLYKLTSRQPHPFLENLNMAPFTEGEADDANLAENIVSILGNDNYVHIIVIEDTVDSTLLPATVFTNNSSVQHVYRVQRAEKMRQHVEQLENHPEKVTLIRLDSWNRLSFNGAGIFPEICKGDVSRDCKGQYRCSSSVICLPLSQVCDGNSQCPFGDDEELCDFSCPSKCNCERYIADCNGANFTDTDIQQISNTARKIDMSNNILSQSGIFSLSETFHRLVELLVSNCNIQSITDHTFTRAKHLIYLDLSYNKMIEIRNSTFDGLVFLRHLILKGNSEIESIEPKSFYSLHSVKHLAITGTQLFELQPNTFAGLNIDELDISDNRISKVHNLAFNDLVSSVVKFDGNDAKDFESDIFAGLSVSARLETPAFKFCCYKPSSLSADKCYPHQDEFSSCEDLMRNSALQTLLWIICILAFVGNLSSITYRILYDTARLKTGFGMFVTNLAVSDFLMGVYMMIIAIADLTFRKRYITMEDYWKNSGWCVFAGIIATVSSEASVLFLCLITLDRILVIKFPFGQYRLERNKAVLAVVVSWIFSWTVAVLPVVYTAYFQGSFYSTTGVCLALPLTRRRPPGWLYAFMIFVILNFVAFIMIATGQLLIYLEIRRNSKRMKKVTTSRRKDLTIARNLLLVLTTDFMCWFPVGVMGILAIDNYEIPGEVYAWTAVLILPINSALNPFLYTLSAVIAKKTFNPRIDEQLRPAATTDTYKRMLKLWNAGAIITPEHIGHLNLVDMIETGVSMTTSDILIIAHAMMKYVFYLHSSDHVHGDFKENYIYVHPEKAGKTRFHLDAELASAKFQKFLDKRQEAAVYIVAVRGHPKAVRTSGQKPKDVNDFGLVVRYLLKSTKNV